MQMNNQKPFRGAQINKTHPLAKGLVGCWIFNEATGNKVFDLSGHGNNGTINGADWCADGLDFNGTTDNINVGTDTIYDNTDALTIVTLIKIDTFDETSGYDGRVIANYIDSSNYYILGINNENMGITFRIMSDGNVKQEEMRNNQIDMWYSVAAVFNGNEAKIYINDVQGQNTNGLSAGTQTGLTICSRGDGRGHVNSRISYVYIYNRALSTDETRQLNVNPYQMFDRSVNPAILYYESVGGVNIPVFLHHYNQMRS